MQVAETTQLIPTAVQGDALYLTPYIQDGQIYAGQDASFVSIPYLEGGHDLDSWSGYISVGPNSSYHLFFWFFCCNMRLTSDTEQNKTLGNSSVPLLIWLNGGPGYSSMVGLFEEIGPLRANINGTVTMRDIAWTKHFDVIFIDDLMDTGFSYAESGKQTTSVKEAAEHLYEFIGQFYQLFPDAKAKDLYIGGQSYGGKYAPELAGLVNKDKSINLKGVFLSSGLMNPRQMLPLTPDYLLNVGLLNDREAMAMRQSIEQSFIKHKSNPKEAVMDIIESIFHKLFTVMGHGSTDNIVYTEGYKWTLEKYLNQPEVQKAIHVKPTQFVYSNDNIIKSMSRDFLDGVEEAVLSLLRSDIKVLVCNGQLDPIVSVPMTEEFLTKLEWSGNEEYVTNDQRIVWKDEDGIVAGYVTKVENLTRVLIRNAGHRTAIDQPRWALDMMRRFILDLPFSDES